MNICGVSRIRGCSEFCSGVCQRKCVARGVQDHFFGVVVCNLDFDCIANTQGFLGIGCSSWDKSEPV